MAEAYKIRKAEKKDAKDVFELSNEDYVRYYAIHKEKIKWEDHVAWFKDSIQSQSCFFHVIEGERGRFIGQVRYALEKDTAVVSISLSKVIKGKGLSRRILLSSMEGLLSERSDIVQIDAYVYDENIPSIRLFTGAGYVYMSQKDHLHQYRYEVKL